MKCDTSSINNIFNENMLSNNIAQYQHCLSDVNHTLMQCTDRINDCQRLHTSIKQAQWSNHIQKHTNPNIAEKLIC